MTLSQFQMHRANLARGLESMLDGEYEVQDVEPIYCYTNVRFLATVREPNWGIESRLVCVGPGHPMFMETDGDGSGCAGTWVWESDIARK